MKRFVIDCSTVRTAEEFWQAYLDVVEPQGAELFGRNLDAFNDALAGGPGFPGECELSLVNSAVLGGVGNGTLLRALREIASEPGNETVTVVLR